MIFLDTNVLIYAADGQSAHHQWARRLISRATAADATAVNPIVLAEFCTGTSDPNQSAARIQAWGIILVDLPVSASVICAQSYRLYRMRRLEDPGKSSPTIPLPDFFIGAHAEVMGWELATADPGRFKTYFPNVRLLTPDSVSP